MSNNIRFRLSIMMFLQYAFNGIWYIPLAFYLSASGYTGVEIGFVAGTTFALGAIISPFFVGMIADRFFSAEKVLGVINIISSILLLVASQLALDSTGTKQPVVLFWILLAHFLFYMPTWALTNSIALYQMDNPGKQFPAIRVMGTFGWILVSTITLFSSEITGIMGITGNIEATQIPMILGACIGIISGLMAFILPNTPPKVKGVKTTIADVLGLKALALFKDQKLPHFCHKLISDIFSRNVLLAVL